MTASQKSLVRLRVLVTGGTKGLGLALVQELTRRGASVAFVARDPEQVAALSAATPLLTKGGSVGVVGDVANKDDIHRIALAAVGRLGGLDVLIHNASSLGPVPRKLLADTECEELELALATNVVGPHRLTRAVLGALASSAREGRGGVVLAISSDAALTPYAGWGAYGASKAALHHGMRIWDEERPGGVRFLSRDPGDMDTELHAVALPDADRSQLASPDAAAALLIDELAAILHAAPDAHERRGAVS